MWEGMTVWGAGYDVMGGIAVRWAGMMGWGGGYDVMGWV